MSKVVFASKNWSIFQKMTLISLMEPFDMNDGCFKDFLATVFLGQNHLAQRHFGQSDVLAKVTFQPKMIWPNLLEKWQIYQRHFGQFFSIFFHYYPIFPIFLAHLKALSHICLPFTEKQHRKTYTLKVFNLDSN